MLEDEKITQFLYVNKKKYVYILGITATIDLALFLFLNKFTELVNNMINITYLVGSFCVLMIIMVTYEVYKEKFLKIISIYYSIVALYAFQELLVHDINSILHLNNDLGIELVLHIVTLLAYLIISMYICDEKFKDKRTLFCIISVLFIISIIVFYNNINLSIILDLLIIVIIFIETIKILGNFYLVTQKQVNYILISAYGSFLVAMIYMGLNIFSYDIAEGFFLPSFISFFVFVAQCIIIVQKLLTNPYKILFKDLFNKNQEMNELNKEIVAKNRELEYSQILIKKKEKMLRSFFINVPLPLIIINSGNQRIVFSNNIFLEMIGKKSVKDIINKKLKKVIDVEEDAFENISENNYLIRGTSIINGEKRYFDMEFVDVLDNEDEIIVIFNDVSNKIKADTIKETIQNKIFEESIKRDFLSNISHDLKTPINVIFSATQLLKYYIKQENKESIKKYINISKQNCITLIRLTNNLIDSSRIYSDYLSPNLEVKNIVEIIEEIVTSLIDYANNKSIELIFDTNEEEIYASIDEEFMQRIILNLLSNAMKFTPKGGKIEIVIEGMDDKVSVNVTDNGVGMDKEFIENAFNRYSMGSNNEGNKEKGTGIGLFVVKKLVEKQGGTITVHSERNKGTNFELLFEKV